MKTEKQENANEDPNSFSTLVARYHSAPSLGGGSSHHQSVASANQNFSPDNSPNINMKPT